MRLPSPLVVGTAAVLMVSGPARAAKPRGAPTAAPGGPAAADTAAPPAKAPGSPAAPDTVPATPAPTSGADVSKQPPSDGDAAATAPVEPSAEPSPSPASAQKAPVVPSASIRLRPPAGAPPRKSAIVGDEEEQVKPARDTVGGHLAIGVNAGLVLPFGSVASGVPQSRTLGVGWSFGGDLAYGISRTVMLGAYVDVGLPEAQGPASGDSVTTIAAGPLLRYHLVQGVPFDPWVAGGLGFRRTSVGKTTFTGVDWARLSLGGDWYPAPNLGFGPILELSLGTFFSESPGTLPTKSLDAHFVAGVRVVFDAPGK